MSLADTSAALLTARRALNTAEVAHANAIAAEVRASVPGPWVAVPEVGAIIEQGAITVGVSWGPSGWTAWAGVYSDDYHRAGVESADPRAALSALRGSLDKCRGANARLCLALVTRLLRGWV